MIKTYIHQQQASHVQVSLEAVPEIKQYLLDKGQAFLDEIDQYLSKHEVDEKSATQLSISVFYHEADNDLRERSND